MTSQRTAGAKPGSTKKGCFFFIPVFRDEQITIVNVSLRK